ncbi:AAA family ATPase [Mucilaginibacter sp. 14171R-50]|uniref:ATP-binding protein n=1 Tax=Mucilaginibacter sp. 14171R-50 TaxID=2703789 RepID=UPI00138BBCD3|nr:ATP-binding protein [Mucilaginibacter sp. 14171R-50]QHS55372.1 AAA family ATPase [Mucilaginibacter sp. 14171R-50]
MKQIIFAGGIHGVGKSTLCREITHALSISYLSASEVLKWTDINVDAKNKKVVNISDTQNRLINGLEATIKSGKVYLLDGHYCLFNMDNQVIPVPMETFIKINPIALILVTGSISVIKATLEQRDHKIYDTEVLELMQEREASYANEIAVCLNVPLFIFDKKANNLNNLIKQIHESLA